MPSRFNRRTALQLLGAGTVLPLAARLAASLSLIHI